MTSRNLRSIAVSKSLSTQYIIRMGFPNMDSLFRGLQEKYRAQSLSREERNFYEELMKALRKLHTNPHDPELRTHEVEALSRRYRRRVWQSSLQKDPASEDSILWVYGPVQGEITVVGVSRNNGVE